MEFKTISTLLCCVFVNITHNGGSKGEGGMRAPPPWIQTYAVFGKILLNRVLTPLESWHLHLGEILDPPLKHLKADEVERYFGLVEDTNL